jgi:DNA mismatch repair protein PMS2
LSKVEVSDNGKGIKEDDFVYLGRKHCTSKLNSLDDFKALTTFGFRGEALNAICNISSVEILTSTEETAPIGYNISFDKYGNIISNGKCAKEVRVEYFCKKERNASLYY